MHVCGATLSAHASLAFALGLCALCALSAACFIVWLLWSLFWEAYDSVMQQYKRIKNSELYSHRITPKFNVGSDVK